MRYMYFPVQIPKYLNLKRNEPAGVLYLRVWGHGLCAELSSPLHAPESYRRMGQAARQLARVTSPGVLRIEKI